MAILAAVADAANVCRSAIWERIDGWEVVLAVLIIVAAWAVVDVARMYFMAVIARNDKTAQRDE
jgi:hypothetical protein